MTYFVANIEMEVLQCDGCNVTFATTSVFIKARRDDHKIFYCPNGCIRYYPQESGKERLQRLLDQERECCIAAREEAGHLERRVWGYKGQLTKAKKQLRGGE